MGFEAVLGTGDTVSHMGGLMKDNTGYDLGGLLCGSEGTLGVVTAARVRLVPPNPERVTAILALLLHCAAQSTRPRSCAGPCPNCSRWSCSSNQAWTSSAG